MKMVKLLFVISLCLGMAYGQQYEWAKQMEKSDMGTSIKTRNGFVYITGTCKDNVDLDPGLGTLIYPGGSYLGKYDANGDLLWAFVISPVPTTMFMSFVEVHSMDIDSAGNIVVVGNMAGSADFDPGAGVASINPGPSQTGFVARYDNNGNYLWAHGIGGGQTSISTVTLSESKICIGGTSWGGDFDPGPDTTNLLSVGISDGFFAMYDINGNFVFMNNIGSIYIDRVYDVDFTPTHDIAIAGFVGDVADFDPGPGTSTGSSNSFVSLYDSTGALKWFYVIPADIGSSCEHVESDANSNIYTSGNFRGTMDIDPSTGINLLVSPVSDYGFIAKYDMLGNLLWGHALGNGFSNMHTESDFIDKKGHYFLTGGLEGQIDFDPGPGYVFNDTAGQIDLFIAEYAPDGHLVMAGATGGDKWENSLAISADDNHIYITGYFTDTCDFDFSPSTSSDFVTSYMTAGDTNHHEAFFAKYSKTSLNIISEEEYRIIATLYPNPNTGSFEIVLPYTTNAQVNLIRLDGETVLSKQYNNINIVHFDLNAAGLYLVEVITPKGKTVKKLLVQNP